MWPFRTFAREQPPPWGKPIDRDRDRVRARDAEPADARVRKDLSLDAVFAQIDRCVSAVGQERLRERLRLGAHAAFSAGELASFDAQVRTFDDPGRRSAFRRALRPLGRAHGAADLGKLLDGDLPPSPPGASLFPIATAITLAAGLAIALWPKALVLFVACVIVNIAIRLRLNAVMTAHADALLAVTAVVATARMLGLEFPRFAGKRSLAWATMDVRTADEITGSFLTYINVFFLVDVNAFVRSLALVRRLRSVLVETCTRIGDLDAAHAVASFRAGLPRWSSPVFTERGTPLRAVGVDHPLVHDAVPNDAALDPADGWLVLGSNASGKSTFARALALQTVLAQSIATTTCRSYSAPLLLVRTIIAVEDSIATRRSHFMVEAEAARDMLLGDEGTTIDRLCIVDELFRGTNTADRVAAAAAFLRALRRNGAMVIAATHDAELLGILEEFRPHYFTETVTAGDLAFDYRLRAGAVAPRNALAVLALAGLPDDVLAEARALEAPVAQQPSSPAS